MKSISAAIALALFPIIGVSQTHPSALGARLLAPAAARAGDQVPAHGRLSPKSQSLARALDESPLAVGGTGPAAGLFVGTGKMLLQK